MAIEPRKPPRNISLHLRRALGGRAVFAERLDGTLMLRRGFTLSETDRVLVVEDVLTTGGSTRETMQVATAGMLFLYFLPEMVFALRPGLGWRAWGELASWERQLGVQAMLMLAVPGVSAVRGP